MGVLLVTSSLLSVLLWPCQHWQIGPEQETDLRKRTRQEVVLLKRVVLEAFDSVHDGWSSDEVILQNELNENFVKTCSKLVVARSITGARLDATPLDFNWTLMNLRKAGKLNAKTTKRKRIELTAVQHVAEIAARSLIDDHQCSIDRIMCDPELRTQFDEAAREIDGDLDSYAARKAAFQLRKARRLKPELIGRIADWGRKIDSFRVQQIVDDPTVLNEHPGVYIFRDESGYLYIGQTENLRERLKQHLDDSHNLSLAKYLRNHASDSISIEVHDFDPDSQASKTIVRRAYESELIASRKPRFNVQP